MNKAFQIVYWLLMWIAEVTGFSYNEVNIIAYYLILPFAYVFLADRLLKWHVMKIVYIATIAAALLSIRDFSAFSDWLFQESVDFLLSFSVFGWNYIVASVLVCVVFPAMFFGIMLHFAYPGFVTASLRFLSSDRSGSVRIGTPGQGRSAND